MPKDSIIRIAENRKARHDYTLEDDFEAGMVLLGTEVKSLRDGRANLKDAYAAIKNGEVWVHQLRISPYTYAHQGGHDPLRPRKLLLHKHEIKRLIGKVNEKGYALIPLKLYFRGSKVKLKLALARGKKRHDKRESIRRRDQERDLARQRRYYGVT